MPKGDLIVHEDTGEFRSACNGEEWIGAGGIVRINGTVHPVPILRRLSDEEAKELQGAAALLAEMKWQSSNARAEADKLIVEAMARLRSQLASRPALSEVEELAGRLLIADIGGPCQQSNCDLFNIAAEFIAFRTARREKHGETT